MIKLKHLFGIIKRHTRFPLTNINHEWCEGGDPHYHICYAARLLGSDLPKVCPHCTKPGFEPEHEDVCDFCKYFGIMDITESGFNLDIDSRVVRPQQPAAWIRVSSDKAAPHRGWSYSSTPVLNIVKQYADRNSITFSDCPMVVIDGVALTDREVYDVTIGAYIGEKQELNMSIEFERSV